jgi:hypothetical protein
VQEGAHLVGVVSTEGGPLLIADRELAAGWTGAFGTDYQRACDLFDADPDVPGGPVALNGGWGMVWDMPTGTAEVWRRGAAQLTISRPWVDPDDVTSGQLADEPPRRAARFGQLEIRSGWLLIVWAAEEGREASFTAPGDGVALDLSIGHAGLIVAVPVGQYALAHDEVEIASGSSRRCFIDLVGAGSNK